MAPVRRTAKPQPLSKDETTLFLAAVRFDAAFRYLEQNGLVENDKVNFISCLEQELEELDVILKRYPSGSNLRLHPIIEHVKQEWENVGKDMSKFDLQAISLGDVEELCQAQGGAYQFGDLRLHYWKITEDYRWWLPPLQQSVPIMDTDQNIFTAPAPAPASSSTSILNTSTSTAPLTLPSTVSATSTVPSTASTLSTASFTANAPGHKTAVVPTSEDDVDMEEDGDRETPTRRRSQRKKRAMVMSPSSDSHDQRRQRLIKEQSDDEESEEDDVGGPIEEDDADGPIKCNACVKYKEDCIPAPHRQTALTCAYCTLKKLKCRPTPKWARDLLQEEKRNPKPKKRRTIIETVAELEVTVDRISSQIFTRLNALDDYAYNNDKMMRALCAQGNVDLSSLGLRVPAAPIFPKPTAATLNAPPISTSSSTSSTLGMGTLAIAAPVPRSMGPPIAGPSGSSVAAPEEIKRVQSEPIPSARRVKPTAKAAAASAQAVQGVRKSVRKK